MNAGPAWVIIVVAVLGSAGLMKGIFDVVMWGLNRRNTEDDSMSKVAQALTVTAGNVVDLLQNRLKDFEADNARLRDANMAQAQQIDEQHRDILRMQATVGRLKAKIEALEAEMASNDMENRPDVG